jgi:hypothetical protein
VVGQHDRVGHGNLSVSLIRNEDPGRRFQAAPASCASNRPRIPQPD